eukprot:1580803-Alexandrium_andersonii.AAC.1
MRALITCLACLRDALRVHKMLYVLGKWPACLQGAARIRKMPRVSARALRVLSTPRVSSS